MVEVKRNMRPELGVGELARRSGVSVAAIHFYERKGLIKSIRTTGNQRRFARATLRRVALIKVAKNVGMPLAELGEILSTLPDNRTPNRRDWQKIAARWHKDITNRIATLRALSQNLTGCIGCGCLSLSTCRLLNGNDKLAARGRGAVRIRA
jgi:MerR family transcriptional regulator, redox-sensitive transcriptional activator SoxR